MTRITSSPANIAIRFAFYVIGFLVMTIGIAISVKSDLGVSPVSSIPYTMTVVWGIEMGQATILFHIGLVILQVVLLRRAFKAKNLLQVPVGVLFGLFTSLGLYVVSFLPDPANVWIQLIMTLISALLIAFGIFLYVPADMVPLAGEGAMLAVSQVTKIKFSTVKIAFDSTMVALSLITCLVLVHSLGSVGIGTIIAAFLVGSLLKAITKVLAPWRDRVLSIGRPVEAAPSTATTPLLEIMEQNVFTLSLEDDYADALRFLHEHHISGAPVVNGSGTVVGFVSDGDILRRLGGERSLFVNDRDMQKISFNEQLNGLLNASIRDIAVKNVISVNATDDLSKVSYVLAEHHLKKAPVMSNGQMVGIINRSNITDYATRLIEQNAGA